MNETIYTVLVVTTIILGGVTCIATLLNQFFKYVNKYFDLYLDKALLLIERLEKQEALYKKINELKREEKTEETE